MSLAGSPLDLTALDAELPAQLDPAVWLRNLAALERVGSPLANLLTGLSVPETWRPAQTLDGTVSLRIEPPGQPPAWLGNTAAPRTRATALFGDYDPAGQNLALPCIGAGQDVAVLLGRLAPHLALYVFEADAVNLAAALRLVPLDEALAAGQLILIPPGNEAAFLADLMAREPGLHPPGALLAPNLVDAARRAELQAICQRLHTETTLARSRELLALADARVAFPARPVTGARLAVLALTPHVGARKYAEALDRAARAAGWDTECCTLASPREAHPLHAARRLSAFAPTTVLHVGYTPAALQLRRGARAFGWVHDAENLPSRDAGQDVTWLAASPRVVEALHEAGFARARVVEWFWSCAADVLDEAAKPQPAADDAPFLLVGNLPDRRPETYGVTQDTLKQLWQVLERVVADQWQSERADRADWLLVEAERRCQRTIRDEGLRAQYLRLTRQVIIPAVTLEALAGFLLDRGAKVETAGCGWQRLARPGLTCASDEAVFPSPREGSARPAAAIFAGGPDPLSGALVQAAAVGWPVLLHAPGGRSLSPELGGVLEPQRHIGVFADLRRLRELIDELSTSAARARVAAARRHVTSRHTMAVRLSALEALVGGSAH